MVNFQAIYSGARYHSCCLLNSALKSVRMSCAPLTMLATVFVSVEQFFPVFYYSHPNRENPSESFVLSAPEDLDLFIQFYERFGLLSEDAEGAGAATRFKIDRSVKQVFADIQALVSSMNEAFELDVKLCACISDKDVYAPYLAVGGKGSFSSPLIKIQIPKITVPASKTNLRKKEDQLEVGFKRLSLDERKFVVTHEYCHIINNDALRATVWHLFFSILSCVPWFTNLPRRFPVYVLKSCFDSFLIKTVSDFFYTFISRYIEKRADLEALAFLNDNTGAVRLFQEESEREEGLDDFLHPPTDERLEYCQDWQNDKLMLDFSLFL